MSATPRILIAGHSALASSCACLLRRAGHDVTLIGNNNQKEITLHSLWGDCRASGFHHANTTADLSGAYDLIVLTDPRDASRLRPFAADESLALALLSDRETLDAVAKVFGPEQTLGAQLVSRAIASDTGEAAVAASEKPLAIGPLEVSDCVMMENIHRWIRAFQAAGIPCEATTNIVSLGQMAN